VSHLCGPFARQPGPAAGPINGPHAQTNHMKRTQHATLWIAIIVVLVMPNAPGFDELDRAYGNLYRLSDAKPRSIGPENLTGETGKGGMATEGTGKNTNVLLNIGPQPDGRFPAPAVAVLQQLAAGRASESGEAKEDGSPQ